MRPLKCRQFAKLCVNMEAEQSTLIPHREIRWLSMFPCFLKRNYQVIRLLILYHFDTLLLTNLDKYFPLISVNLYDWMRNPFVEFEPSEEQFTLRDEEELASVLNDMTLKLKHSELNLNAFCILVEKEYPAIAQKASCPIFNFLLV